MKNELEYHSPRGYLCQLRKGKLEKSLDIALEIRKFEIELYWKRATYFWAFAATLIAFMALIYKNANFVNDAFYPYSLLTINSLLIIVTYIWYLVARGSKYWQENWEQHVAILENEIVGPIYGSFLLIGKESFPKSMIQGLPFSVSKLNMCLIIIMLLSWIVLHILIISKTNVDWMSVFSFVIIFMICYVVNKAGRFSYFDEVVRGKQEGKNFIFVTPHNKKV